MVGEEGKSHCLLKAKQDVDEPNQPPVSDWHFLSGRDFQKDEHLTCVPLSSPPSPCSVRLTLSGHAKEIHEKCEGVYKSTDLLIMGRQVNII